MKIKKEYTLIDLYYVVLFLTLLTDLLGNYTYFGDFVFLKYIKNINQLILVRVFSILIITKYYKKQDLMKSVPLIMLSEITCYFSGSNNFLTLFYMLAAGKKIDTHKIIRLALIANIYVFVMVFSSSSLGIINNNIMINEMGKMRYSFGFTHPNTMAIVLVQITLATWCINKNKITNLLVAFFSLIVCYYVCYSRTASIILFAMLLLEIFSYLLAKIKGIVKKQFWKFIYLLGGFSFFCIIISFAVASNMINVDIYNDILSGRIGLMQSYFNYYDITLFGQPLKIGASAYSLGMSTLDNSYLFLLLSYGVVVFVLYLVLFIKTTQNLIHKKENEKLLVFMLYAFYGMLETVAIRFIFNFSLCFFNNLIWGKKDYD